MSQSEALSVVEGLRGLHMRMSLACVFGAVSLLPPVTNGLTHVIGSVMSKAFADVAARGFMTFHPDMKLALLTGVSFYVMGCLLSFTGNMLGHRSYLYGEMAEREPS